MSKKLIDLIEHIPGPARRYCHLQLRSFNPNSKEIFFLSDFKNISNGKTGELKSNSTRLYDKLLDILFSYYAPKVDTLNSETRLLKRALVLNKLGMRHAASHLSEEVISNTIQDHNYIKCLEAFDLRLQFAFEQEDMSYLHHYMSEYRAQKEQMVKDYMDLSDYQTLWMIVKQGAIKHHFYSTDKDPEESYFAQLLDRNENELTAESQLIFYKIKGFISMKEKKPMETLAYMLRTKSVYDNNPWLALKDPLEYAKYVKNTCITFLVLQQLDKAKTFIDNFESEMRFNEKEFDQTRFEIRCIILGIQIDIMLTNRDFDIYRTKFSSAEKMILKHHQKLPLEIRATLMYGFFLTNLHFRNFRSCKAFLNILIEIDGNVREDIHELAKIGELTLHFLEGNTDLLENRLKFLERKLVNERPFFKFTPDVLIYFILKLRDPLKKNSDRHLALILKEAKKGELAGYYNFNPLLELKP